MLLKELYDLKLIDYKLNGKKESPDKLLAMLLLPERDNYEPLMVSEGEFYKRYQVEIDKKIVQVENDFNFTKDEIIQIIEDKGIYCTEYEHDKIWFVFCEGFGSMHWGLMYHKDKMPEEIYSEYFDDEILLTSTELKFPKLHEACKKYPEIQLSNYGHKSKIYIEKNLDKIVENGFIEKFCLSDEERQKVKKLRYEKINN
jgi:hypothetical protein